MYRLRTFGGLSLGDDGHLHDGASASRKTLALLTLVAASGERGISRDRLLAYLWPESDADRARGALRQMLHALPRQLEGARPVVGLDELRLDPTVIESDAQAFDAALARDDLAGAVALYAGPFLDGFHLSDAPEFERWVDDERARCSARHATALERLAVADEARGDHAAAVARWRRLAALEPLNGRVAAGLARVLGASGDRAAALHHLQAHTALFEGEIGSAPDPAVVRLAAQLRTAPIAEAPPVPAPPTETRAIHAPAAPAAPVAPSSAAAARPDGGRRPRTARRPAVAAGFLLAATLAGLGASRLGAWRRAPTDTAVIAVLPFRVAGADPSLRMLREGMVDLLAAKLSAGMELRAADAGSVLRTWRHAGGTDSLDFTIDQDAAVAIQVGAGRFVVGAVAGTPAHVTLSATLYDAASARRRAQAEVGGPGDSLPALVDRLAASLLALGSGEDERRLSALTSTSLPALRAYLAGQSLARQGAPLSAGDRFARAVELDSTFALAAFELMEMRRMAGSDDDAARGARLAWAARGRLGARDRARLIAHLGPRFPDASTVAERVGAADRFVALAPDDADAWSALAVLYFHFGRTIGIVDWRERAIAAFERASALDPADVTQYDPLSLLYADRGDTANLRRVVAARTMVQDTAADRIGGWVPAMRYQAALQLGERAAARTIRRFILDSAAVEPLYVDAIFGLVPAEDGDSALQRWVAQARSERERGVATAVTDEWTMLRGHPAEVARLRAMRHSDPADEVMDMVFWDGDAAAAAAAVPAVERELARTLDHATKPARTPRSTFVGFALAEYRLATGDTAAVRRVVETLRGLRVDADSGWVDEVRADVVLTLDAQLAALNHRPEAPHLVARLDSILRRGPKLMDGRYWPLRFFWLENFIVTGLWEREGDRARALAASRRWTFRLAAGRYLTTALRSEGRLAELTGDRAGAVWAYRHYLSLRSDPEPRLRPESERMRAALVRLEQGGPPR